MIETFLDEDAKQPAQYLFLASPKISTTRDVEVEAVGCYGFSHVVISESASAPAVDSVAWQACSNSSTVYTYQINTTTVGEKTLYFHTRLNNSIGSYIKSEKIIYAPKVVLGTPSMNDITSYQKSLNIPHGMTANGSELWLADYQNNRILKYNTVPTSSSAVADLILGQPSYQTITQNYGGVSSFSLYGVLDVEVDNGKLFAADYLNNRILIWNSVPTSFNTPADVVLGQPNFTSVAPNSTGISSATLRNPKGIYVSGGKLFVADGSNNRVLIWNTIPTTNAQPADIVLGQPNMTSATATASTMSGPTGIVMSGSKLFICDYSNHRVLVWNTVPTIDNQPADFALGQTAIASNTANVGGVPANNTLNRPYRIAVSGTKVAVTDYDNHRVLIWNSIPNSMQQPADVVLGQPNFSTNTQNYGGLSDKSLNFPRGVQFVGDKLIVSDGGNNRLLIWNTVPTVNYTAADTVVGHADFTNASTHHTSITGPSVLHGTQMFTNGQKIIATDILSHRVLIWNSIPTTNYQPADLVLGQSNFSSLLTNGGSATSPTAQTLNEPAHATMIGNKLAVVDRTNHRVLIWNTFPTVNGQSADVVLGQTAFTSMTASVSSAKMSSPSKIYSDGTKLFLADEVNNRVLIWNTVPTISNTPADVVLGQVDFLTKTVNSVGISAATFNSPSTIFGANNKLFVGDSNHRILVWNTTPTSTFQAADLVIGQPNFTRSEIPEATSMKSVGLPRSIFVNSDNSLFTAGTNQGSIKIWKTVPTSNFTSADMVYGYSYLRYQPTAAAPVDEFGLQENIIDIYNDGYRFFISDRNRIVITPYPNIMLSQTSEGRGGALSLTARNCDGISYVLFNEGTVPSADDSNWQTCSTDSGALDYTISTGSEGRRDIKVWYKDSDGHVLPEQQGLVPYIYDLTPAVNPSVLRSSSAITNSLSGTLTNYSGCNTFTDIIATTTLTPPSNNVEWESCSTATSGHSYTMPEPVTDGVHNIYVWSRDSAGNISASPTVVTVTIDRTGPVSVPALTLQRKNLATVSGFRFTAAHCTDVDEILISESDSVPAATDSTWQTCSTTAGAIGYTTTQETNTIHNFRIWAKDVYGNIQQNPAYLIYTPVGVPSIIGQINALTNFHAQTGLQAPSSVHTDGTRLVVADTVNHRVLIWNTIPNMQTAPDIVIGQDGLVSIAANRGLLTPTANSLYSPTDAKIFGSRLVVADTSNNRILIWNTIPTTNGQAADLVLGQPDFTSKTANNGGLSASTISAVAGLAYNGTQFFAADRANHRVLMWNSFPTANNQAANVVIGQPTFLYNSANKGGLGPHSLSSPYDVATIGANQIAISDYGNNRVLIWNTIPTTHYALANMVLGQPDFISNSANNGGVSAMTLNGPRRAMSDGTIFLVADSNNARLLIWNSLPTNPGQAANIVVGQAGLTSNTASTASNRADSPLGMTIAGTKLFLADRDNDRVSVYNTIPVSHGATADYALGQATPSGASPNTGMAANVNGSILTDPFHGFVNGSYGLVTDQGNSRVLIWNSNVISGSAQVVVGQPNMASSTATVTATGLNNPRSAIIIGTKLVVADHDNNRVLIWNSIPTINGQAADVVLGQSTFTTNTTNQGGISSATLYNPYEVTTDGTRLIVADSSNNRVLIWNTIPTVDKTPADIVLGQPNFTVNTANNGGRTGATLYSPTGVSTDGTRLLVADYDNGRVLIWNSLNTITSNQAADIVVGQADFVTATQSNALNRMRNPHSAIINGGKLYVSDRINHRVLIFDTIPATNGVDASHMIGQTATGSNTINQNGLSDWSLNYPSGLYFHNGLLHVVDTYNDRIIAINPGL